MITQWMVTQAVPILGGLVLAAPLGAHLGRVWLREKTILDVALAPLERRAERLLRLDPPPGQAWVAYALRLLALNAAAFAGLYFALRLSAATPEAAFRAAMMDLTASGLGAGLAAHGAGTPVIVLALGVRVFVAGGSSLAIAQALSRAVAGRGGGAIGNVWSDLIRNGLYVLAPGCVLLLAALAVVQTIAPSARPIILNLSLDAGGFACALAFGKVARAALEGRALLWVMALVAGPLAWLAAAAGSAVRSGREGPGLFAALDAAAVRGGGSLGIASLVMIALLAVYIEGLLVGRSPEYVGKRLGVREAKLAILASLALWGAIMACSALAALAPALVAARSGPPAALWMGTVTYDDTAMVIVLALGRFGAMIPILALAGSIAGAPRRAPTAGVPTAHDAGFVGLLTMMVVVFAVLRALPALVFAAPAAGG